MNILAKKKAFVPYVFEIDEVVTSLIDLCITALSDSYKVGMNELHNRIVKPVKGLHGGWKTQVIKSYSNFTPRKNAYMDFCPESKGRIVVWGQFHVFVTVFEKFQRFFKTKWSKLASVITDRLKSHFGGDVEKDHSAYLRDFKALHKLGYLPILVRSVEEGTSYPVGLPVFTVESTEKHSSWIVNNLETFTSSLSWPLINTATIVEQFYLQAKKFAEDTIPEELIPFWLPYCVHNFELRGMFGPEHGVRSGAASCLFFRGSDTNAAIDFFQRYYGYDPKTMAPICESVRATEHADITRLLAEYRAMGIVDDTEYHVMAELIERFKGIFSYVADSENYFRTISKYALWLRDKILAREDREDGQPARFVFRPDSSKKRPLEVIMGDPDSECELERKGTLQILWEIFGGEIVTVKGVEYKIINPKVSVIYGEAISMKHQREIYQAMKDAGWSVFNQLMGKGSYANLNNNTRDLFSMTYKQTFSVALINDKEYHLDQQKIPMGDVSKRSDKGMIRVELTPERKFVKYDMQTSEQVEEGELKLLFQDGLFYQRPTYQSIVERYAETSQW